METKTQKVRNLVASGEYKSALQICKDWYHSDPNYREILRLGYECLMYPSFYRQLGRNPDEEYEKAVNLLKELYT